MSIHMNDIEREKALEEIMQWDYEATGDLAPWDYDDEAAKTGSAKEDMEAFVVETGWRGSAKDNPKGFESAFAEWHRSE